MQAISEQPMLIDPHQAKPAPRAVTPGGYNDAIL